jgi:hypothetical protein
MTARNRKQILISPILRWVFLFDAVGTGLFALMLIFFANITGKLAGVDAITTIRIIGIGSLFPAFFGFWTSKQKQLPASLILLFAMICMI